MKSLDKKRAVISVGAGHSQLPLILEAKNKGLFVLAIDRDSNAAGSQVVDFFIVCSTHDALGVLQHLKQNCNTLEVVGVLARTTAPEALRTGAVIAKYFGLPPLTERMLQIATEKSKLREFCVQQDLPVPVGKVYEPGQEIILPKFNLPVIVKPDITKIGKAHINLCTKEEDFEKRLKQAVSVSANQKVEVEEYLSGIDVSCLCYVNEGVAQDIAWWDELVGIAIDGAIVGLGVSVPSVIEGTSILIKAKGLITKLMSTFKEIRALLIFSLRISSDGDISIIEIHADLGGDLIADVLLPASNEAFNFFNLAVEVATGGAGQQSKINFAPVMMCYTKNTPGYQLYRASSSENNLTKLASILAVQERSFSIPPLHLHWLMNAREGRGVIA